jgi:RNA polymerase sigma-70 factor (ECF subfamily)
MESEQTIIRLAKSGDMRAFETLVQTYSHRLFATVLRVLGDKDSDEECVQEAFIKVYKKLATFSEDSKFSTWLRSVTMNTAIDLQRRGDDASHNLGARFQKYSGARINQPPLPRYS